MEEEPYAEESSPVNNEFCSACSGSGSLICCEACPKSFHFTCADPPIDEHDVPDDKWFCNECKAKTNPIEGEKHITAVTGIWKRLIEKMDGVNPRVFTLPKRIKSLLTDPQPPRSEKKTRTSNLRVSERQPSIDNDKKSVVSDFTTLNGATTIRRTRDRVSEEGFCHSCNRSANPPTNLLIHCDDCSLQWHLDCLPYPLAVYPSSHRHWTCPLHLTVDNLAGILSPDAAARALDASKVPIRISDWPQGPPRRSNLPVLPEASVRLQFGWTAGSSPFPDPAGCVVPEDIRDSYRQVRELSSREVRLLAHYENYSYVDQAVETNMVI